jgi:O-antigen/teichoic acid export membrane protein
MTHVWGRYLRSQFFLDVATTFGTKLLLMALGIVTSVITAKALGPAGRGYFAVAMAISALGVQFGNLGLQISNTYFAAKSRSLVGALVVNSGVATAAIGLFFGGITSAFIAFQPKFLPVRGWLLALAVGSIPIGLMYLLLQNLLIGIQKIQAFNAIELFNRGATALALVALLGLRMVTAESAMAITQVIVLLSTLTILFRLRTIESIGWKFSGSVLRDSVLFGSRAFLVAMFGFIVLRSDLFLVKQMLGAEPAGYYSVASSMADMVFTLPTAMGTVLFPKLVSSPDSRRWTSAKRASSYMGVAMLLVVAASVVLARPIVTLLYGHAFDPVVAPFTILAVAMIFYGTNTPLSVYMASIGYPLVSILCWGLAAAINIVLNLRLIPAWGIMGAAISSLVSYAMIFVLHLVIASRLPVLSGVRE